MDQRLIDVMILGKGKVVHPKYPRLKNQLLNNLTMVQNYLRQSSFVARTQSVFYTLLDATVVTRANYTAYEYWDLVTDSSINLQRTSGITSEVSAGKAFQGSMYPPSVKEYIVAVESDMPNSATSWKDWCPITILDHTFTDLSMNHFDSPHAELEGHVVIGLDLPLLVYQYSLWREEESKRPLEDQETIAQFLMKFPFANSLASHLDCVIFNRVDHLLRGQELPDSTTGARGITLLRLDHETDEVYQEIIGDIMTRAKGLGHIIENLPLPTAENLLAKMHPLNNLIMTRQVMWANVLSSIRYYNFAVQLSVEAGEANNSEFKNRIERLFRSLNADRSISRDVIKDQETIQFLRNQIKAIQDNLF